jgi:hypothetical protein
LSGGLSNITRQHAGDGRVNRICAALVIEFTESSTVSWEK